MTVDRDADYGQIKAFLETLAFDETDRVFCFQALDDRDKIFAKHQHANIDNFHEFIRYENILNGRGLFVTVNKTNGAGRKTSDIVALRALFMDVDLKTYKNKSDVPNPRDFPIPPSIHVSSKGGPHYYWLLKPGEDLKRFWGAQMALSKKYGSDGGVKDLPRVMRVPGTYHYKSDPHLVSLVNYDGSNRYTINEIIDAFNLGEMFQERTMHPPAARSISEYNNRHKRLNGILKKVDIYNGVSEGSRDVAAIRYANICLDLVSSDEAEEYLLDWNKKNSPPLDDSVFERKIIPNAISSRWHPIGWKNEDGKGDSSPKKEVKNQDKKKTKEEIEEEEEYFDESTIPDDLSDLGPGEDCIFDDIDFSPGDFKRSIVEAHSLIFHKYKIRKTKSGAIYVYSENKWRNTKVDHIKKIAVPFTTMVHGKPSVINQIVERVLTRSYVDSIEWNRIAETEIALKEGVLDFTTGLIRKHDPKDYIDRYIPYKYDPKEKSVVWENLLNEWIPGEEEQNALKQFFGYILMSTAKYKKALILYGGPNTGKSQVCKVAEELVGGLEFTCSISLDQMGDPRERAAIKGKALNIITELSKNITLDDGGFKQLVSTEETISIDQKYLDVEQYRPTCKHIFATNNLPRISDMTDAVYNRLLILQFKNEIPYEKQDANLFNKLKKEMPGILNWAIEGAKLLHSSSGRWPKVSSSDEMIKEYKELQNPMHDFIEESGMVIRDEESSITIEDLRDAFNAYHGQKPWSKKAIREKIDSLGFSFARIGSKRGVKGLRLKVSQGMLPGVRSPHEA